jgi:hypothetical protein
VRGVAGVPAGSSAWAEREWAWDWAACAWAEWAWANKATGDGSKWRPDALALALLDTVSGTAAFAFAVLIVSSVLGCRCGWSGARRVGTGMADMLVVGLGEGEWLDGQVWVGLGGKSGVGGEGGRWTVGCRKETRRGRSGSCPRGGE